MAPPIEVLFAQKLGGNDPVLRARAVKKLGKWLGGKTEGNDEEMLKLWKGLYYCYWMSDKPLIQEELAERIGSIIESLALPVALSYARSFLLTISREWFGIDNWRIDKFMTLIRRMLRRILSYASANDWSRMEVFMDLINDLVISTAKNPPKNDIGFRLHFIDIYLEELAKVGGKDFALKDALIVPFITEIAYGKEDRIVNHIRNRIFLHLVKQSDLGIAYEAYQAGQLPSSSDEEDDEEEDMETEEEPDETIVLDPRAGKVDVTLPQIIVDHTRLSDLLFEAGNKPDVKQNRRNILYELTRHFKALSEEEYPLALKIDDEEIEAMEKEKKEYSIKKLTKRTFKESIEMMNETRRNKQETKNFFKEKRSERLLNGMSDENQESKDCDDEMITDSDVTNKVEDANVGTDNQEEGQKADEPLTPILSTKKRKRNIGEEDSNNLTKKKKKKKVKSSLSNGSNEDITKKQLHVNELKPDKNSTNLKKKNRQIKSSATTGVVNKTTSEITNNEIEPTENVFPVQRLKGKKKKARTNSERDKVEESPGQSSNTDGPQLSTLFKMNSDWGPSDSSLDTTPKVGITKDVSPPFIKAQNSPQKTPIVCKLSKSKKVASEKKASVSPKQLSKKKRKLSLPSTKKVNFAMAKNRQQSVKQHTNSVVASPEIPFVPDKKPKQGVLKVKGDESKPPPSPNPKLVQRNTIINAKSKAAKLLGRSKAEEYFIL